MCFVLTLANTGCCCLCTAAGHPGPALPDPGGLDLLHHLHLQVGGVGGVGSGDSCASLSALPAAKHQASTQEALSSLEHAHASPKRGHTSCRW